MPSGVPGSYKTYNCLECGIEKKASYSSVNKFCGNKCQVAWQWRNETIPRIERGEATHNSGTVLKRYLIEKYGEKCFECGLGNIWQNKPLMLQLEHTDGDSDNNKPSNLKLLCPNCHSQTPTFGSKGCGSRYKKDTKRNKYLQEYKARTGD